MRRFAVEFSSVLSALLLLATLALWARSFARHDHLELDRWKTGTLLAVSTSGGEAHLSFERHSELTFEEPTAIRFRTWPIVSVGAIPTQPPYRFNTYYGLHPQRFAVPLWWIAAVLLPLPSIRVAMRWARMRRGRAGLCRTCGYDLRFSRGRCPECGQAFVTAAPEALSSESSILPARSATLKSQITIAVAMVLMATMGTLLLSRYIRKSMRPPSLDVERLVSVAFVRDDGDMDPEPIEEQKDVVKQAIMRLTPGQKFSIIGSDGERATWLSDVPILATPDAKDRATAYLDAQIFRGDASNVLPAIDLALRDHPAQMYLICDGDFADNDAVARRIAELNSGHATRVDTVLITSATASDDDEFVSFFKRLADAHGGQYHRIRALPWFCPPER